MWLLTVWLALADAPDLPAFETVSISAGSFRMGCSRGSDQCWRYEKPRHSVTLTRSIEMMTAEVSQNLYTAVTGKSPWVEDEGCIKWGEALVSADLPAVCINWVDAILFANALSVQFGLERCYAIKSETEAVWDNPNCTGWRLPTEAEWEYAATGGQKHPYAGAKDPLAVGWTQENSDNSRHATAKKAPNAFGLYDMSGNVWEWCWDWLAPYQNTAVSDPLGPFVGTHKVRRGGSWYDSKNSARNSERSGSPLDYRSDHIGLRLVRIIEASQ